MSLACQIKHYADQVSTNANLVAASLEAQSAGLPHDISPELASVRMELAEAAFELFNLSQDTGSFLTHLTVDVSWHFKRYDPDFRKTANQIDSATLYTR